MTPPPRTICIEIMETRNSGRPLSSEQESHFTNCRDCRDVLGAETLLQTALIPEMAGYSHSKLWEKLRPSPARPRYFLRAFPMALAAAAVLFFFGYGRFLNYSTPFHQEIPASANLSQPAARVADFIGGVMVRRSPGEPWEPLSLRTPLRQGDLVRIPSGAAVRISFPGGTNISMHGAGQAQIRGISPNGKGTDYFYMTRGLAFIRHFRFPLLVQTPTISIHPVGTVFSVRQEEGTARVSVYEGEVRVEGTQGWVTVGRRRHVVVNGVSPMKVEHLRSEEASPWEKAHLRINDLPLYREQQFWKRRTNPEEDQVKLTQHMQKHEAHLRKTTQKLEQMMEIKHEEEVRKSNEILRREQLYHP